MGDSPVTFIDSKVLQCGLPNNVEAEQFVLGSILLDTEGSLLPQVAVALGPEDFHLDKHRKIFRRMVELNARSEKIEYLTLVNELDKHGQLEACNGIAYIASLTDGLPRLSSIESYVRIVKDKSRRRRLMFTAQGIIAKCIDGVLDTDEISTEALVQVGELSNNGTGGTTLESLRLPDLSELSQSEEEAVVPGLLPGGGVTLITGGPGDGKSLFALSLAGVVATGAPFLGQQTSGRRVLYLDRENPKGLVKSRHDVLGLPAQDGGLFIWGGWVHSLPPGPESRLLVQIAQREKPLMIFDSLVAFHPGDENSASETRRFMDHFRRLANAGATVVIIHHTGKSETAKQYRGSSDIAAAVDAGFTLTASKDERGRLTGVTLRPFKDRAGQAATVSADFTDGRFVKPESGSERAHDVGAEIEALLRVEGPLSGRAIENRLGKSGISRSQVRKALKAVGEKEPWRTETGARGALLYRPRSETTTLEASSVEEEQFECLTL